MDEPSIRRNLRRWILDHAKNPPIKGELTDDTPVLEQGILSSLDVVEFVLYIESLRGDELDAEAIEPDSFRSVDTMWTAFFAPLAK